MNKENEPIKPIDFDADIFSSKEEEQEFISQYTLSCDVSAFHKEMIATPHMSLSRHSINMGMGRIDTFVEALGKPRIHDSMWLRTFNLLQESKEILDRKATLMGLQII